MGISNNVNKALASTPLKKRYTYSIYASPCETVTVCSDTQAVHSRWGDGLQRGGAGEWTVLCCRGDRKIQEAALR